LPDQEKVLKKFAIPLILTATILVAGIFAFTPVYEVTAVHTQIIDAIDASFSGLQMAERANAILDVPSDAPDGTIIMLYDGLGNAETGDIEFNGNVVTGTEWTLEYRDSLAGAWTLVPFDNTAAGGQTAASSPTDVDHFDRITQGLRLVCVNTGGDPDECDTGTFVNVTVVGEI